MQITKITSPVSNLSDVQYKFCVSEKYEKNHENRKRYSLNKRAYMIDEKTYAYENPYCESCYSHNVINHGYNPKMIIDNEGNRHNINVRRYY
jgi:hypothetical protein